MSNFKCNFCPVCDGCGCISQMPGMGGPMESRNFMLNCAAWKSLPHLEDAPFPEIRLAPMTGGVENVGYDDERDFYFDLINACHKAGVKLSLGDGCPDTKLQYGIEAVENVQSTDSNARATVFIKPYPDEKILERFEKSVHVADGLGIDIDSYNIITMRQKVHLEKKTPAQLKKLMDWAHSKGLPFLIKGVFTKESLDLIKEVKPDVASISNHGGRVETRIGSTAEFLHENRSILAENSGAIWVDGGIRNYSDAIAASSCGASTVMIGRPFASAICRDKENGVKEFLKNLSAENQNR